MLTCAAIVRSSLAGWAAFSIAAGIGTAMVFRYPAPLADSASCLGLVEFLLVIASRTWRDVPLGSMLTAGNLAVTFLALLLLARAIHAVTSRLGITLVVTLAAAASPLFALTLAPSLATGFLVMIAAWGAGVRACHARHSTRSFAAGVAGLASLAAVVPPFTVPAAVLAGWLGWRHAVPAARVLTRAGFASVAIGAVVAISSAALGATGSSIPSCALPDASMASWWDALLVFGRSVAANPLVAVLALLGVLSHRRLSSPVAASLCVLAAGAFWGTIAVPEQAPATMAPLQFVVWVLAAIGLAEVFAYAGTSVPGRVGAVALSSVIVALQVANAGSHHRTGVPTAGHERLTLATMGALIGSIPRGAGLVTEDASTDLLARALPSRLRTPDRFHVVSRDAGTIANELQSNRVFALPRSQRILQHAAIELIDVSGTEAHGLAEVRNVHACTPLIGSAPTDLSAIVGSLRFGLVAADDHSRGPVVIMLAAEASLSILPIGWPPEAVRGIHARTFDRTLATDRRDLSDELRSYALAPWSRPDTRYVTRIEAWRTPGAPLVLPVSLGGTAIAGVARSLGEPAGQPLRLCPSFPYEVRSLSPDPR
jgi:hypothetical protein